jgi:hypothetical protein
MAECAIRPSGFVGCAIGNDIAKIMFQSGPNSLVMVNDRSMLPSAAVKRVGLFREWWLIR